MLILGLLAVVRCGEQVIVKAMSLMVYPFIVALLFLAVYLIPHWNGGILSTASVVPTPSALLNTLWLAIPVMVFSFNHSPIISAFAVDQKRQYGAHADERSAQILSRAHLLMVVMVLFFVFSCVLTLSPGQLAEAKAQNLSSCPTWQTLQQPPKRLQRTDRVRGRLQSLSGQYIAPARLRGWCSTSVVPRQRRPGPHDAAFILWWAGSAPR